jgi:hypothetical protein
VQPLVRLDADEAVVAGVDVAGGCITRAVVQTLVTDPIWNRLSAVASTPVSRLTTPSVALCHSLAACLV